MLVFCVHSQVLWRAGTVCIRTLCVCGVVWCGVVWCGVWCGVVSVCVCTRACVVRVLGQCACGVAWFAHIALWSLCTAVPFTVLMSVSIMY